MKSTWNKVLDEIAAARPAAGGPSGADIVRRAKLAVLEEKLGRPTIVYATACTTPGKNPPPDMLQIDFSDKIGFRAVTERLEGDDLDVVLHSPGGRPDAVESLVDQLRSRFKHIRYIVPNLAKSAATMLVMSGDQILGDEMTEFGPIDPQMVTIQGISPAEAIRELFDEAQELLAKEPQRLPAWIPVLSPLGPSLLKECEKAVGLGKDLVRQWLEQYMFNGKPDAARKANDVAEYLSDWKHFKTHGRRISIENLATIGVNVFDLRTAPDIRQALWELYCAYDLTFANSAAVKIFENAAGDCVIKQAATAGLQLQFVQGPPQTLPAQPSPASPPPG